MPNFIDQMASNSKDILQPNRFKIRLFFPAVLGVSKEISDKTDLFAMSTEIPSKTIGTIEVPTYGGHKLKYPGNTEVPDWSCSFMVDPKLDIHKKIIAWQELCDSIQTGLRTPDVAVFGGAEVRLLDSLNQTVSIWEMVKIYPTEAGSVSLSKEETDSIIQMDTSFIINDIITPIT